MKKGFTLIELMVVILIVGILSAVAAPKFFGITAKAKAAEVGPAAGSWSKLQQAFIIETGNWGSFIKIGYKVPGADASGEKGETDNFKYSSSQNSSILFPSISWYASNKINLEDCTANSIWEVKFNQSEVYPKAYVNGQNNSDDACTQLTPNFSKIR